MIIKSYLIALKTKKVWPWLMCVIQKSGRDSHPLLTVLTLRLEKEEYKLLSIYCGQIWWLARVMILSLIKTLRNLLNNLVSRIRVKKLLFIVSKAVDLLMHLWLWRRQGMVIWRTILVVGMSGVRIWTCLLMIKSID